MCVFLPLHVGQSMDLDECALIEKAYQTFLDHGRMDRQEILQELAAQLFTLSRLHPYFGTHMTDLMRVLYEYVAHKLNTETLADGYPIHSEYLLADLSLFLESVAPFVSSLHDLTRYLQLLDEDMRPIARLKSQPGITYISFDSFEMSRDPTHPTRYIERIYDATGYPILSVSLDTWFSALAKRAHHQLSSFPEYYWLTTDVQIDLIIAQISRVLNAYGLYRSPLFNEPGLIYFPFRHIFSPVSVMHHEGAHYFQDTLWNLELVIEHYDQQMRERVRTRSAYVKLHPELANVYYWQSKLQQFQTLSYDPEYTQSVAQMLMTKGWDIMEMIVFLDYLKYLHELHAHRIEMISMQHVNRPSELKGDHSIHQKIIERYADKRPVFLPHPFSLSFFSYQQSLPLIEALDQHPR